MIVSEENPARIEEPTPEEETKLEKSQAPTLRDLRAAARDLLIKIATELEQNASNSRTPRQ